MSRSWCKRKMRRKKVDCSLTRDLLKMYTKVSFICEECRFFFASIHFTGKTNSKTARNSTRMLQKPPLSGTRNPVGYLKAIMKHCRRTR